MIRHFLKVVLTLSLIVTINSCGSSSSDSTDDSSSTNTAAAGSGAAVGAVFGGMGGDASVNEQASIPRKVLELFIKRAIAQEGMNFTACDSVSSGGGPEGITMSLDGTDATYGNAADALVVASGGTFSFCTDGGDVASWTIPTDVMEVDCMDGDTSFTIAMSGSGVFREDSEANETNIRGSFVMTSGSDTIDTDCSFDITHDEGSAFGGVGCEGGVTADSDIECTTPGS